jgi:L,D-peptidoglycan transpeptidase YkuD (ErfK/YbiS/YcfS/YnhG family)
MTAAVIGPDCVLRLRNLAWRASIGRSGITADKREGDGGTPVGVLPLRRVLFRADRVARPRAAVTPEPLAPHDGWCDDAGDASYNCPVRLPYPGRAEALWLGDTVYDVIGVLGWNDAPVVKGRGSAIFLHVARPDYAPTEGCVALALPDLLAALAAGLTAVEVRGV